MKLILIILAILLFAFLFLGLSSCALFPKKPALEDKLPKQDIKEVIIEKVKTEIMYKDLGWIQGVLILGATGALIACFMKVPHIGIPVFIGCVGGLALIAARVIYPQWLAIIGLVGGVGAVGYAVFVNRRAFTQVIAGGERFKIGQDFEDAHRNSQSKTTKKLVAKARRKINGKEKT